MVTWTQGLNQFSLSRPTPPPYSTPQPCPPAPPAPTPLLPSRPSRTGSRRGLRVRITILPTTTHTYLVVPTCPRFTAPTLVDTCPPTPLLAPPASPLAPPVSPLAPPASLLAPLSHMIAPPSHHGSTLHHHHLAHPRQPHPTPSHLCSRSVGPPRTHGTPLRPASHQQPQLPLGIAGSVWHYGRRHPTPPHPPRHHAALAQAQGEVHI